ncbi:TetR/AcrR family transcriptional regulator [Henriciella litoralis]|uniref:TetR/AcrR family transcriptional regulator n=1 Tax=Henriciella litoralis TaxID=568102 RepID=UPI000A049B94|nr:TetR/AcrR family transcriptional regulator [Henriciella litoralis]
MPYSAEHKQRTRDRVVECARRLFNRHGYDGVTIDMVMKEAKLTRGGFYNHFQSKEDLFLAAVSSFLMGRGAEWRADAGIDPDVDAPAMAARMVESYLSEEHLNDVEGQCPLIALSGDVSRSRPDVQEAYETLLKAMVGLFEDNLGPAHSDARRQSQVLAALCVGGMVLARTLPESDIAADVRQAALEEATRRIGAADAPRGAL